MSRSPSLSLIAAIVLTGIGLAVALSRTLPGARWLGGAIVGGGIATMHYTGMAAFEIQGRIVWDPVLVIVSIAAGALLGAAATRVGLIEGAREMEGLSARCCLPRRSAATISRRWVPPRSCPIPGSWSFNRPSRPAGWPSASPSPAWPSCCSPVAALALDIRDRRRAGAETDRMRGLANAAVEGLLVCDGETIVTVNQQLRDADPALRERRAAGALCRPSSPTKRCGRSCLAVRTKPIETGLARTPTAP